MIHDYAKGNSQQVVDQLGSCYVNILDEQYCTPIPLTEQWLIDFGFSNKDYDDRLYILFNQENKILFEYKFFKNGKIDCYLAGAINQKRVMFDDLKIKYAHQLQNLYFCLCGEELQLRENNTM